MDDLVHIACCFDQRMELPFLVLANSIKRHLQGDRKVVLHAFHSDPLTHHPAFSKDLNSNAFEVVFTPTQNHYNSSPIVNSNTVATLMRLMLPGILKDVRRLLYIDTDVIVLKDLIPLHDTDLGGKALAAVIGYSLLSISSKENGRIGVEPNSWQVPKYMTDVVQLADWKTYFNAGVLLMDLEQFREKKLSETAQAFLERTKDVRLFNDQDALNHVVNGAFTPLDPRWNVNASRHEKDFDDMDADLARVGLLWKPDPWLIHYCGRGKPWLPDRPATKWDSYFWREAEESAALPLLANFYLEKCEELGLTKLQPAATLLASTKPALDRSRFKAHASKFQNLGEVSRASMQLSAKLEKPTRTAELSSVLVSPGMFRNRDGIWKDRALVFDLKKAAGHLIFGPYLYYPPGNYEVVFEISLSPEIGNQDSKLVIEVTDNSNRFLAQRDVLIAERQTESQRTLNFTANGKESFLEFRIFAEGFARGWLRFTGVSLRTAISRHNS